MRYLSRHLFIQKDLTRRIVKEIYEDDFIGLQMAWENKKENHSIFPTPKHSSTIQRWLLQGIPIKVTEGEDVDLQLFGFCALLDVDALAIFDYDRNGFFSNFKKIRQLIYSGSHALIGGLTPILRMYGPSETWPSDRIANTCYGRPWFGYEITNSADWGSFDYFLIKAKFSVPVKTFPRAIHIAYKRVGTPDNIWKYYGTVLLIDGKLHLYHENGNYQFMDQVDPGEIRFRTYYGGGNVAWRITSLHEFEVEAIFPFNDNNTIGFNW